MSTESWTLSPLAPPTLKIPYSAVNNVSAILAERTLTSLHPRAAKALPTETRDCLAGTPRQVLLINALVTLALASFNGTN